MARPNSVMPWRDNVLPGQQRRPAHHADPVVTRPVSEAHAFPCEFVDSRRPDNAVAAAPSASI